MIGYCIPRSFESGVCSEGVDIVDMCVQVVEHKDILERVYRSTRRCRVARRKASKSELDTRRMGNLGLSILNSGCYQPLGGAAPPHNRIVPRRYWDLSTRHMMDTVPQSPDAENRQTVSVST